MMKKTLSLLCALALTAALLAGCGASEKSFAAGEVAANTTMDSAGAEAPRFDSGASNVGEAPRAPADAAAAKLIYSARLELETTGFDGTEQSLYTLVEQSGGYLESSSVENWGDGYRHASYTARVPANRFEGFLSAAGALCHVLSRSTGTENVSEDYYDVQGRLETQKIKLQRLQELLARADKMEDILTVENAICETEAQIENLSGTLRQYDALVDFSTVEISLNEVYRLSNTEEPAEDFSGRLSAALRSGWKGFVSGLQAILLALAYGWMWLVLAAAIAAAAILLSRRAARRRAQRIAARAANAAERPQGTDDKKEKT